MGLFRSAMMASGSPEFGSLARFSELGFFSPHSYHCYFQHMAAQEFYYQRCFRRMSAQVFCCPRFFPRRCPRTRTWKEGQAVGNPTVVEPAAAFPRTLYSRYFLFEIPVLRIPYLLVTKSMGQMLRKMNQTSSSGFYPSDGQS